MDENGVVRFYGECGIIKRHGTRPTFFAATSAQIKLVYALPLNHALSRPKGVRTYSKMMLFGERAVTTF